MKMSMKMLEVLKSCGKLSKVSFQKNFPSFVKMSQENISTYSQLVEFAVKCDIPLTWLDRVKEDYPEDSQSVVNQVFYEWWDRCNLNLARKL